MPRGVVARGNRSLESMVDSMWSELDETHDVTDDELAAIALAADPDTTVDKDAVSLWELGDREFGPLPSWYMPPVSTGARIHPRWRRRVAGLIILAFVVVDAYGLCSTYGSLVIA